MRGEQLPNLVGGISPLGAAIDGTPFKKLRRKTKRIASKPYVAATFMCHCGYRTDDRDDYQAHLREEILELRQELTEVQEALPRSKNGRRMIAKCGTPSGARRHRRLGELTCDACREADQAAKARQPSSSPERRSRASMDSERLERYRRLGRERMARYRQDPAYREELKRRRSTPEAKAKHAAAERARQARLKAEDPTWAERQRAKDRERKARKNQVTGTEEA